MLDIQLSDNTKARIIGPSIPNVYKKTNGAPIKSQLDTYEYFNRQL